MSLPVQAMLVLCALANALAFAAMAWDKRRARRGASRVPEARLVGLVALGGLPGLWAAGRMFRHKTRKRSFQWKVAAATLVWLAWAGALIAYGGEAAG